MINPDWPRWIFASVSQHFEAAVVTQLFMDGTHRPTELPSVFAEFRQTGPFFKALNGDEYETRVVINLLYKISMQENNFHTKHTVAGDLASGFTDTIPLFQIGDPDVQIGCLQLDSGPRILHYGQIEKELALEQGTVEGTYITHLS
jgi:hypothetical protein